MKKKIISLCLIVALAATAIVGASLAYFTDTDSVDNVFTVGNISIDLVEDFTLNSLLMPGKKINKDVQIKNDGENDAYVWYTYAIPEALLESTASWDGLSDNVLHTNHAGYSWLGFQNNEKYWQEGQTEALAEDKCWNVDWKEERNVKLFEDDDTLYRVVTVLYNGVLAPNDTTAIGMTQVYLDTHVDCIDGTYYWVENGEKTEIDYDLSKGVTIYVNAYGIQAEGFATAEAAYNAYQAQWTAAN